MKARAIPYPHQPPTRGDKTVSVAQGGTATPSATKQKLLGSLKELYIHIYMCVCVCVCVWTPDQLRVEITLDVHLHFYCAVWDVKKRRVYFRPWMLLRVYSNRFLMLRNHTGKVVPRAFHSYWKLLAFDQIQHDGYCAVVWRRFEATFKHLQIIYKSYIYIYIYVCVRVCVCVCVNKIRH